MASLLHQSTSHTTKSRPKPFLIRADSLPSPPPSRSEKLQNRPSFDAALVASPPSSDDIEMPDSTTSLSATATNQLDVDASPSRRASMRKNKVVVQDVRDSTSPPAAAPVFGLKRGWDDPENPFVVRDDAPRRPVSKAKKPDKMTYVFRGKRITYDVSYDALVAPDDPNESPFADPSPRLLFPPAPITPPASTSTSFMNRLLATTTSGAVEEEEGGGNEICYGLPTPAREKNRKKDRSAKDEAGAKAAKTNKNVEEARFDPYRRVAGRSERP